MTNLLRQTPAQPKGNRWNDKQVNGCYLFPMIAEERFPALQHLRQVLLLYMDYYNRVRTHLSLNKDAPVPRPIQAVGRIHVNPILGGLHHHYVRI